MPIAAKIGFFLLLIIIIGSPAQAGNIYTELNGKIISEGHYYPQTAAHKGQRDQTTSISTVIELYVENDAGHSLTIEPFFLYDTSDNNRTHWDIREAYYLLFGQFSDDQWELRLGFDTVFWGVAESRQLINIINQADLVSDASEDQKLGQPMVHFTWQNEYGTVETFLLPYFRTRTFPGRAGRLRTAIQVDTNQQTYESAAKQHHLDFAGRYSQNLGIADIGVSWFSGTNRNPTLILGLDRLNSPVLIPFYEQINQVSLDTQITTGQWLLKLESLFRDGEKNRVSLEEDFYTMVGGFEYTWQNLLDNDTEISILTEILYDDRDKRATTIREKDIFIATRIALNNTADTNLLIGLFQDIGTPTRSLFIDASHRISDTMSFGLNGTAFLSTASQDIQAALRKDSHVQAHLTYHF